MKTIVTFLLSACLLTGCSKIPVYKPDIQQGNVITEKMVSQLRKGMTKAQVQHIMGEPILVNTFSNDRWNYVYTMLRGNGIYMSKRATIYFRNGRVAQWRTH